MKKGISILITIAFAIGMLFGCSKKEDEPKRYTVDDIIGSYSGTLNCYYYDSDGWEDVYDEYQTSVIVTKGSDGKIAISIEGKTITCTHRLDPLESVYDGVQHTFILDFPEQQWNGFTVAPDDSEDAYDCYIDAKTKDMYFKLKIIKHNSKEANGNLYFWNY